jgi:protocatechuate 3,4-dioxygenase beta subunit
LPAGNKVVAVGGFCWGGGQTFNYATHNPNIAAAFVFYGSAPRDEADYKKIEAPVHGFYGGNDFRITGQVPDVEKRMNELGKKFEPVVYEGARHGFMRQGESPDASSADRKAREQAWERWKKLLAALAPAAAPGEGDGASRGARGGALGPRDAAIVTGRILGDGKPLAGALVHLLVQNDSAGQEARWSTSGQTETDEQGRFRFDAVPAGVRICATVRHEGYTDGGTPPCKVISGQESKVPDVELKSRGAFVAGFVVDLEGMPVPGVTVTAWERNGYRSVSYGPGGPPQPTDAKGRFRIDDLPNVPLKLLAYIQPPEPRKERSIRFPASVNAEAGQTDVRIVLDPKLQRPLP